METNRDFSVCRDIIVRTPAPEPNLVVSYSHFFDPIEEDSGDIPHGRSRRWGDAAPAVQETVISEILLQSLELNKASNDEELAFALAVAKVESGFNPDAAAASTSAAGIGQFIDRTGKSFGLNDSNRFNLKENVRAFTSHLGSMLKFAKKQLPLDSTKSRFQRAYALYHDGPSLKFGGERVATNRVLPEMERVLTWIRCRVQRS